MTLQAQAQPGQLFAGWDGDVHSTANPLEITINRNTTVNAWVGRPFGGTPRNVPGLIQAEDFDEGGEGVGYYDLDAENHGGSNYRTGGVDVLEWPGGTRVGWNDSGDWLHYTVNVASAGWYRAVLRTSSGTSGGTAQLRFSGGQVSDQIAVPGTGSWEAMVYSASAPFALPAGIQVVQLEIVQAGFDIDSFELVPVQSTPFGGTAWPIPGVIQAEDFDEGGEGQAYHDVEATNLGGSPYRLEGVDILSWAGAERIGWTANGEWLHYTINVSSAGMYRAVLRAASGGSGGTARLRFSGGQQSDLIAVPGTGAWDALVNITSAPFTLPAGLQVMRLDIVQAAFDLDSLELKSLNEPPVAHAGGPYTINQGSNLILNGSGSYDNDAAAGDSIVSYAWDLKNDGTFNDVTGVRPVLSSAQLNALGLGIGSHTIRLQVTDSFGATGTASTTLTIRGTQTIAFDPIANHTNGDPPFTISATASSGLPVTFTSLTPLVATVSGSTVTIVGAGTAAIRASQAGDVNYLPAPDVDRTFIVAKATPVITWANPADINCRTPLGAVQLNATANVPGTFTYSPASGTTLGLGSDQVLMANFNPIAATMIPFPPRPRLMCAWMWVARRAPWICLSNPVPAWKRCSRFAWSPSNPTGKCLSAVGLPQSTV